MTAPQPNEPFPLETRISTGISGLDHVLQGGLPQGGIYLVEGGPGAGKTTLSLQFLLAGAAAGERVLYIALSETRREILAVANSHGWALENVDIFEVAAAEEILETENTIFHPSEVELEETMRRIFLEVERRQPHRVVLDSLSELSLLAQTPLRYRRQILALKQFFNAQRATVLLLDEHTEPEGNFQIRSLVHGVVRLDEQLLEYGSQRRRLRVAKLRGVAFRGGYHDCSLVTGGFQVFPRLVAAEHTQDFAPGALPSGVPELDQLLGGGLDRGTSTLIMGPAGGGKSVLAAQYATSAAGRGLRIAYFTFDEGSGTLFTRSDAFGMGFQEHAAAGRIMVRQIDPAELSPGEFACTVQEAVELHGCELVVIDSLNGYLNAMPEERLLLPQLHELFSYLRQRGIVILLVMGQHGILGDRMRSPIDVSYLADTVLLVRFFEDRGEVRRALSVVKRRGGPHERTIREYQLQNGQLRVGEPLSEFQGVLSGVPTYIGTGSRLGTGTDNSPSS